MNISVILFQDNQKNIIVGLSGRNNSDSGLFTKNLSDFWTIRETKSAISPHARCFPKKPISFEIYVEFGTFWYQICRGSKNFAFGLMAGKFGKFRLKALFVSCAFIVRVTEAPDDHESTNEDLRGCGRDDKPVFIEEINK